MAQTHSVACPSCGASLKVTKPSLVGKRVPCPSCKTPFVIRVPTDEYIPLTDDPPLTNSGAAKSDTAKSGIAKSAAVKVGEKTSAKSGSAASLPIKIAAADPDDIPLLADEPSGAGRGAPSKAAGKRADSKWDASVRERRKDGSSGEVRPRSDSKTVKFTSQAESTEFDAMLADSSGTDLFDDDDSKPEPPKRKIAKPGQKPEAEVETSEFDAMLADTEEQEEQSAEKLPALRRNKPRTKADGDEIDTIATVEMDVEDEDDGLPPAPSAPGRWRSRGGWTVPERGPLVVWTCVGAGVLLLLLVYVLFSTRPSSLPETPAGATAISDTETKAPEVAEADKEPVEKPDATEGGGSASSVAEGSLLGSKNKGNEAAKKPLKSQQKDAGPPAAGEKSDDATDQQSAAQGKTGFEPARPGEATQSRRGVLGRHKANPPAKTPFDAKTAVAAAGSSREAVSRAGLIGRTIPSFSAAAVDNTTFHSADHREQVLVVAFLGVECPLANLYAPSLAELAKQYRGKPVAFIAVNSNAQDTLEQTRAQARSSGLTFPVLKDAGNVVADLFGAERTPEVLVLDADRAVRYRGMLDDQYGYRERRSRPTKAYVKNAIDALLKSETVPVAETDVQGCHIGRVTKASETAKTSYYRDVLPILQNRCQQCHRKGEIGPFALSDYEVVRNWGPTIRDAVAQRRMPPWPADPKIGKFANDISLSDQEINSLTQWVDEGCPEGAAAEKPQEKQFVDGWNIGKPDKVYSMPATFHVPATGVIEYKSFHVSPVFTKDTWVQGVECRFGNRSVVHHMLVLLDFPKDKSRSQDGLTNGFFAAGAPGSTYFEFPKGYAKKIPKGSRLRFQMHYTPNGAPAEDLSKFGIVLAKGNSFREVQTFALGKPDILIPAGDADHFEWASQPVPTEITLTTLMPHLHMRGRSFAFFLERPDGKREPLLSVPRWDFNWQYQYELSEPLTVSRGSKLVVEAHWDNSANNPNNILPLVDARFGEQTFDEMFIGYINAIPSKTVADATRPGRSRKRG
jgi:peroxiredoxin